MVLRAKVGASVLFVLPPRAEDPEQRGAPRPAIIVAVHNGQTVNLQVCIDGENDRTRLASTDRAGFGQAVPPMVWRTSIPYSETHEPGTWHWPPRD